MLPPEIVMSLQQFVGNALGQIYYLFIKYIELMTASDIESTHYNW